METEQKKENDEEKNFISSQLTRAERFSMILSKVRARIDEYVYIKIRNHICFKCPLTMCACGQFICYSCE